MYKFLKYLKIFSIIFLGSFVYFLIGFFWYFNFKAGLARIWPPAIPEKPALIESIKPGPEILPIIIHQEKRTCQRGIYITENMARNIEKFTVLRRQARAAGINTLVIDIKDYMSQKFLPLIKTRQINSDYKIVPDPWLYHLAAELHREGFIVTVRQVVFKDDRLVLARPDLGIQLKSGGIYRDLRGGRWADPYADEVRLFNELIAETATASGADEIQFDYIRFPAEGAADLIICPAQKENLSKVDIINWFLDSVRTRLEKYNVSISVDIFGVTAWQSATDVKNLGQDLKLMSRYVDVIAPMLYPSHFHDGYDGHAHPGSEPYYFINAGVSKAVQILGPDNPARVIPWIQGFDMKSPNFGTDYIRQQVRAAREAGSPGFLIWNAGNVYDVSFEALKEMAEKEAVTE